MEGPYDETAYLDEERRRKKEGERIAFEEKWREYINSPEAKPEKYIMTCDYTTGGCCGIPKIRLNKGQVVWTYPRPFDHFDRIDSSGCYSLVPNKEPHFLVFMDCASPDGIARYWGTGEVIEPSFRDRVCPVCKQRREPSEFPYDDNSGFPASYARQSFKCCEHCCPTKKLKRVEDVEEVRKDFLHSTGEEDFRR